MAPLGPRFGLRRLALVSAGVGLLGAAGVILGLVLAPRRALAAYLFAEAYFVSLAVGALFLLLIGYVANARWMSVIRGLTSAVALGALPLALLFVPIAVGLPYLYLWVSPPLVLPHPVLELLAHKRPWLNPTFFVVRAAACFAVWIAAVVLLRRWARRHPVGVAAADPERALQRERAFSSVMLPLSGIAVTVAAFDWLMSLDPLWFSTMFGVYFFAGGFLGGIAVVAILCWRGLATGTLDVLTRHHFHAVGRLLFAFTIFWTYIAYFQVFLIYIADKPIEVTFYLARLEGSWRLGVWLLGLGHFAFPFLLLLPRAVKFQPGWVAAVAGWILVFHLFDVYWLVMPTFDTGGIRPSWMDLSALACVGGLATAFVAWAQRRRPLYAEGDPFLPEGRLYQSPQ